MSSSRSPRPLPRIRTTQLYGDRRWQVRGEVHGQVPGAPPPQEPGTRHVTLDDDDSVPELGDSRPDRLYEVRPQERVLRHTVEQAGDVAPGLPALDAPVPQIVDKLYDVLKIVDLIAPAQEIEVPKISSLSCPPPRRVLPVPQTAEQLVDVPLSEWMRLALGADAFGRCGPACACRPRGSTGAWRAPGTPRGPARQGSPPAQGGI